MYSCKVLLVLALATVAAAGPTGLRSTCASECSIKDRFSYELGKSYEYKYKATTEIRTGQTHEPTTTSNTQGVEVQATVIIQPASPCEHVLILEDVSVAGTPRSEEFAEAVTAHSLRFSLQDGRVENVCSSQEEDIWVTNFKKGILSTFQNSMKYETAEKQLVMETDISGTCGAEYSTSTEGSDIIVTKTKSSKFAQGQCQRATNAGTKFSTFGYNLDSLVQGVSPMQDELECTQIISENIMKSVECSDTYTYIPFSESSENRVSASANTYLTLVGVSGRKLVATDPLVRMSTLKYEETEEVQMARLDTIRKVLKDLQTESRGNMVGKVAPAKFSQLVSVLKAASSQQIKEVYQSVQNQSVRKFLIDALPLVGTAASTSVVADMVEENVLSEVELNIWLTSLSFVKDTSRDMFEPLLSVIKQHPTQNAFFGVSSVLNTYCQTHSECQEEREVSKVLEFIESQIGVSCRSDDDSHKEKILVALKALGNAGRWLNGETILRRCFTEDNPVEVKVAAIEAWRKTPCSYNRKSLISTFEDPTQNDEVRIASYMAIMKCPSPQLVDTIKERLVSESVNQVASFVWSHLNNVQESADPTKKYIREMIGDETLQLKFQPDTMKFSRYYESSMYSNVSSFGATSEGSIVFASDSILPRSTNLNLTVNMLGQSVNLLEIGARIEGYEQFLEKFFGQDGYYPDDDIQKLVKNLQASKEETSLEYNAGAVRQPKGSFFMRMFGNELIYKNHIGTQDILEQFGFSSPMDMVTEFLKNKKIEFMKSFNVINAQITVPTITGFPIYTNLDGSASVSLDIAGDYKLENLDRFHLDGKIKPSAAINLQSTILIDAHVTKSGVKHISSFHSATQIEGKATMKGLTLIDFSIEAPEEDVKVYEFSHEYITIHNDKEEKQEPQMENEVSCRTCNVLGISYCRENSYPVNMHSRMFNFLPSSSLYIKKEDTHKSYKFRFTLKPSKIAVLVERPGSRHDTLHNVEMSYKDTKYNIDFHTPSTSMGVKGEIDIRNLNKKITIDLNLGENIHYYGELALNQDFSNGWSYSPLLIIKNKQGEQASKYSGKIAFDAGQQEFVAQATHEGIFLLPSGELDFVWKFGKRQRDFSLKVESHPITMVSRNIVSIDLSGSAKLKKRVVALDVDGHYQIGESPRQDVKISAGVKQDKRNIGTAFTAHLKVPALKVFVASQFEATPQKCSASLDLDVKEFDMVMSMLYETKLLGDETSKTFDVRFESKSINFLVGSNTEMVISDDGSIDVVTKNEVNDNMITQITAYKPRTKCDMKILLDEEVIAVLQMDISEKGKYSVQVTSDKIPRYNMKGFFHTKSQKEKLDLVGQLEVLDTFFKASLFAKANKLSFESFLSGNHHSKTKSDGYKINVTATPKRMHFETNILRDIAIDVELNQSSDLKKAKMVTVYESYEPLEVTFEVSSTHLKAAYEYENSQGEIYGKAVEGSVEALAQWSPSEKIAITATYDLGSEKAIGFTLLTPFPGWEKQEARISYFLDGKVLKGQMALIWKNNNHITSNFNVLANSPDREFELRMSFSSTIKFFERIQAVLAHKGSLLENSRTTIDVEYGEEKIKGKMTSREMSEGGYSIDLMLKSPFTRKLEATSRVIFPSDQTKVEFDGSYGPYTAKLNFALTERHQGLDAKLFLSSSHLPTVDLSGEIGLSKSEYLGGQIDISGKVGEESISITGSVVTTSTSDVNSYKATLKTAFSSLNKPFIMNLGLASPKGSRTIELDLDTNKIPFISQEPMKFHAKGNFFSMERRNVDFLAHLTAENLDTSAKFKHAREGLSFKSELSYTFNTKHFAVTVLSDLSDETYEGSVNFNVQSSCPYMDGINMMFQHETQGRSRVLQLSFKNRESRHKLMNTFTQTSNGWKNVLKYNDSLKIKTQKIVSKDSQKYSTDVNWKKTKVEAHLLLSQNGGKELYVSGKYKGVAYFSRLNLRGGFKNGSVSYEGHFPTIYDEKLSGELTYDVTESLIKINGVVQVGQETYNAVIEVTPESIKVTANDAYSLTATWTLSSGVKKFEYEMVMPKTTSSLIAKARTGSTKDITVDFKHGDIAYNLKGKYDSDKYELELQGPQTKTKVDLAVVEDMLKGSINHDGSVIHVTLKGKFRTQTGRVSLVVDNDNNAQYSGKMSVIYDLEGSKKQLSLEGKIGSQEYKLSNYLQISKKSSKPTEFGTSIVTPYAEIAEASIKGTFTSSKSDKSLELVSTFNKKTTSTLSVRFVDGATSIAATTPAMDFSAKVDFSEQVFVGSYKALIFAKTRPTTYDFTFDVKGRKFSFLGQNVEVRGSVDLLEKGIQWSGRYVYYNTEIILSGILNLDSASPSFKAKLENSGDISSVEIGATLSDKKSLIAKIEHGSYTHSLQLTTDLAVTKGQIHLEIQAPSQYPREIIVKLEYANKPSVKAVDLHLNFDGKIQDYKVDAQLSENDFLVKIESPVSGFNKVQVKGTLELSGDNYGVVGGITTDNHDIQFTAKARSTVTGYDFEAQLPIGEQKMSVKGKLSESYLGVTIFDENEPQNKHFIRAKYDLKPKYALLDIETSHEEFSTFTLETSYALSGQDGQVGIFLQKNDFVFETKGSFFISELVSSIDLEVQPGDDHTRRLKLHFDLQSDEKEVEIVARLFEEEYLAHIESYHSPADPFKGIVKVVTSHPLMRVASLDYDFETFDNGFKGMASLRLNEHVQEFQVDIMTSGMLVKFDFVTPYEGFRHIRLNSNLDIAQQHGVLELDLEDSLFSLEATYTQERILFDLRTPLEEAKLLRFVLTKVWSTNEKALQFGIGYNDDLFEIGGQLLTKLENAGFMLVFVTPFTQETQIRMFYNFNNTEELIDMQIKAQSMEYTTKFGYVLEDEKASIKAFVRTPLVSFKHAVFVAAVDFTRERNGIKVYLEANDSVLIDVQGTVSETETFFNFAIPSGTFGHINTNGKIDRKKRSVDFMMMNDQAKGMKVHGNFHSLVVDVTTPFSRIKTFHLSVDKNPKTGKLTVDYKRNQHFVLLEVTPSQKSVDMKLDAALPGWELLAATGRLDHETIRKYLLGELPETEMTITGKGSFGRRTGNAKIVAKTGLEKLGTVNVDLSFKRRRSYTLKASASANPKFKVLVEFKEGGLIADILIPHSEADTVVKGQLSLFKGNLNITSRFPSIKSYSLTYEAILKKVVDVKMKIVRNGVERFVFEIRREEGKGHFLLEVRVGENHSKLHYHRMGLKQLDASFERNGKELSIKLRGKGQLPRKGDIDYDIVNSFRSETKEVSGTISIDRTAPSKTISIDVSVKPSGRQYTVNIVYNIELSNIRKGDFSISILPSVKKHNPIPPVKVSWDFNANKEGILSISYGRIKYDIKGKLSLRETDVTIDSNRPGYGPTRVLAWRYKRTPPMRDYFFKYGTKNVYTLLELKGNIQDIRNADVKGRLRLRRMRNELSYSAKWSGDKASGISGDGSFSIGNKQGTFKLHKLKRDPTRRASVFKLTGTSNIPGFTSYSLEGEYDLSARSIDVTAKWDRDSFAIKTKIDNFSKKKSENKISLQIPRVGPVEIVLSHDFTKPLERTIQMKGSIAGKPFMYKEHWTRNEDLTVLDYQGDIQSNFLGTIKVTASYDVSDIDNAKAKLEYTRDGRNNINIDWHRTVTDTKLENEFELVSKSRMVPSVKAYTRGDYSSGVKIRSGIEWANKKIEAKLTIGPKKAEASLTTPFERFGSVSAVATYKISPKKKEITFHYDRLGRKVDLSVKLATPTKKDGSLTVALTSPFPAVRTLNIDASWKNGNFQAKYKRNDITVDFNGKANVKQGNSSFDVDFTLPSGKPVSLKLAYNLPDFIKGTSKKVQKVLSLDLTVAEKHVVLNLKGYRTPEKVVVDLSGSSNLGRVRDFHIKLDSELNLSNREGMLDVKINDFTFDMKNKLQRLDNGYYFRSQMHSSATSLPGLTIGFGREGKIRSVTLGYGDEREVTISINGKASFKKGFYGKIDIPRRGIIGLDYDINYNFKGQDRLIVEGELTLKSGKKISLDIDYHSENVKGRLTSPWTGQVRARRSLPDGETEFAINDSAFTLYSTRAQQALKKGIKISGMVLGEQVGLEAIVDINPKSNSKVTLFLETPFQNYKNVGGTFSVTRTQGKCIIESQISVSAKISASIEMNSEGNLEGRITFQKGPSEPEYVFEIETIDRDGQKIRKVQLTGNENVYASMSFSLKESTVNGVFGRYSVHGSHEFGRSIFSLRGSVELDQKPLHQLSITVQEKSEFKVDISALVMDYYSFQLKSKMNDLCEHDSEVKLRYGKEKHVLIVKSTRVSSGAQLKLKLKSKILPFNKIDLTALIVKEEQLKIFLQAVVNGVTHKIELEANDEPVYVLMDVVSPLFQSGSAKAEFKVKGKSLRNMKIKLSLEDSNFAYLIKINADMESQSKKTIDVDFRSPIEELKKLKFGIGYEETDVHKIYAYVQPLNFFSSALLGVKNNVYQAAFELNPGKLNLPMEPIAAKAVVPINEISPKLSLTLYGDTYDIEGHMNFTQERQEAGFLLNKNGYKTGIEFAYKGHRSPYEIKYAVFKDVNVDAGNQFNYQVMFDSSLDFRHMLPIHYLMIAE